MLCAWYVQLMLDFVTVCASVYVLLMLLLCTEYEAMQGHKWVRVHLPRQALHVLLLSW